nr:MAG TPA: hypothetical protein [Caudoviricetes sp.]
MDATLQTLRILAKGKITDLSFGFSLGGAPFSIFVRPKKAIMDYHTVIRCKLLCDTDEGEFPVPIGDWTPGAIVAISPDAINLDEYEIFWGSGQMI